MGSTGAGEQPPGTWVAVGRLGKTHGLHGEITVHLWGPSAEWFTPGLEVVLASARQGCEARVAAVRRMGAKLAIRFEGLEHIEDVQPFVGRMVEVRVRDLPKLEEGSYYHFELIGLEVLAADGQPLGVIEEILETAGNDVFCVRDGKREILVPVIRDAIASIDLAARRVVLKDLKGLIEP